MRCVVVVVAAAAVVVVGGVTPEALHKFREETCVLAFMLHVSCLLLRWLVSPFGNKNLVRCIITYDGYL